jgi:hypothetical protein
LLSDAGDATYDILAKRGHIDDVAIEAVRRGLEAARDRRNAAGVTADERLQALLNGLHDDCRDAEITGIVANMEIDKAQGGHLKLLYEVNRRYPQAFADGLLRRAREGRTLLFGADDLLTAAGVVVEDDGLADIARWERLAARMTARKRRHRFSAQTTLVGLSTPTLQRAKPYVIPEDNTTRRLATVITNFARGSSHSGSESDRRRASPRRDYRIRGNRGIGQAPFPRDGRRGGSRAADME